MGFQYSKHRRTCAHLWRVWPCAHGRCNFEFCATGTCLRFIFVSFLYISQEVPAYLNTLRGPDRSEIEIAIRYHARACASCWACHVPLHSPTAEGACRAGTRPRVCSAASRTHAPRCGVNALPLSASAWPTQPSRSRGHTPQSGARRGRAASTRGSTRCADRARPRRARRPGSGSPLGQRSRRARAMGL